MDHRFVEQRFVCRVLLSLLCGVQGVATIAIDLNRTHATNPGWVRHARFHVVWQTLTMALLAVVEVGLIWGKIVGEGTGFYLALVLAGLSPVAFLLAWVARKSFDGALSDPKGIPPLRVTFFHRERSLDMNMVAVVTAMLFLAVIGFAYRG